ncbi:hypothetical protein HU200_006295 [Digitaria exilis]|uniref:Uncharacterized protein n=1 Tax=Digitaria exilis TaxID=1010633 RepID=A0A835FRQ4_9POAL|nr:hypothetical protein HU200_006295 [Digitaria exilis]
MWACRSFLMSRPRTLHNSIRRHAVTEPPAVTLGAASRWLVSDTSYSDRRHNDAKDKAGVSSPRRNDGEPGTPAPADRRRTASRKQLYLVLNDAKHGNGIHKLDMDTDVAAGVLDSGALPRLPNPPVLRFDDKWMKPLAVLGSKVIGMSDGLTNTYDEDNRSDGHTLTFDTRTAKLALVLDLPNGIRNNRTVLAVAAGDDRLFVIEDGTVYHGADYDNKFCMGGGLHCLKLQDDDTAARTWLPKARAQVVLSNATVSTTTVAGAPSRTTRSIVIGRATATGSCRTFIGQAHYDEGLNAWVGLHAQRDGLRGFMPDGNICACDVPGLDGAAVPDWKLGKEKLFYEDPERHVDAKLVAMGSSGRFCLVEIMTMPGVDWKECLCDDDDEYVLRLTAFRVEYENDRELTTTDHRPARSFMMRDYGYSDHWLAFWA